MLEHLSDARLRALKGVEVDYYVMDEDRASVAWAAEVKKFCDRQTRDALVQELIAAHRLGKEIYLDVKCPFGHERVGLESIESLSDLVGAQAMGGFHIISRSHRLLASLAPTYAVGPIVSDGLLDLVPYVSGLGATSVVATPLFLDRDTVRALSDAGIQTVVFTRHDAERLAEALCVEPHRTMVSLELLQSI